MLEWSDLQTIAAIGRHGSLSAAARALSVHPTTITRRLAAVEEAMGERLFLRHGRQMVVTPACARVLEALDPLADAVDEVARRVARGALAPIRLATTENGARIIAAAVLPRLAEHAPDIELDILASNHTVDLTRGEAELAIRVVEPTDASLIRRRLGEVRYGIYASASYLQGRGGGAVAGMAQSEGGFAGELILAPGGLLSRSPEAVFVATYASKARVVARCSSLVALASAAEEGAGLVVLPTNIAIFHPRLVLVRHAHEIPARAAWLVMHQELRDDARIKRVAALVATATSALLESC